MGRSGTATSGKSEACSGGRANMKSSVGKSHPRRTSDTHSPSTFSHLSPTVIQVAASDPGIQAFGDAVRQLRTARGMSQELLAEAADLDRTYVGGIERGTRNPSLKNILRLARALGVPPSQLFADIN